MGKIKKAISVATGSILLGSTLLLGCTVYTESKKQPQDKKVEEKVLNELNRQSIDGIMTELKDRKSSLKFSGYNFDFDNADILKYYKGNSDKLVIYIRDIHKSSAFEGKNLVQDNLYNTIDELYNENGIDLLVLEGGHEEELTKGWIKENGISFLQNIYWYLSYGFWTPETKDQSLIAFSGGVAYEYFNDTKIKTCGAEDANIHETAWYIATNKVKSEGQAWLFEEIILNKRSEIGVEKTLDYMKNSGKKEAVLVFGAAHTKKILEHLEKKGVSYVVVQPKGIDDYIQALDKYVMPMPKQ